jgi:hypothetical protein
MNACIVYQSEKLRCCAFAITIVVDGQKFMFNWAKLGLRPQAMKLNCGKQRERKSNVAFVQRTANDTVLFFVVEFISCHKFKKLLFIRQKLHQTLNYYKHSSWRS